MSPLMPAAFIGHGNPMNAIEHNRYTESWTRFGASIEKPKAILVISAHWYVNITAVTAMRMPRTIHDFYGFPPGTLRGRVPGPGRTLDCRSHRRRGASRPTSDSTRTAGASTTARGRSSSHMFPAADVPVLQLSINAELPFDYHFNLGAQLHALRSEGVLIVGSGNVVHNLRLVDFNAPGVGTDWAHRFDDDMREIMTSDASELGRASAHGDYRLAVPTPDHFLPLAYVAGLSAAANTPTRTLIDGYEMGSLSMTAYELPAA